MKLLLSLMLFASSVWAGDCKIEQTSQMVGTRSIGEVTDLVKFKSSGQCRVKYRIKVDNEWHTVDWSHSGLYQEEILCQMAIRNGTNQLLVELPGKFQTESTVVCKERAIPTSLKKGYEGEEFEFGKHPVDSVYRRIGHASKCRYFQGWTANGYSERTQGVICENMNNLWTVVDKF